MRCQSCHSVDKHTFCTLKADANILKKNCIDCHMPEAPSKVLTLRVEENKAVVPSMVRTHLIAVYDSLRVLKN
jgi:nitrate/TMAO reductase-like tetraheme cytochrome c subunit